MSKILLIHWNLEEGRERVARLEKLGHEVRLEWDVNSSGRRRAIRADPPDLILIDLSRLPAHGREFATALRQIKYTRFIPLVFAGGEGEKLARIRGLFPDAAFTDWAGMAATVRKALARPVVDPVLPPARDFSATPLYKKLAIRTGDKVALVGAPEDFEATLGDIPEGVEFLRGRAARVDVALLFVTRLVELDLKFPKVEGLIREGGKFWIIYPKKASKIKTDLTQADVRAFGIERKWVDYKVCAVDGDWTGFLLGRSRKK